MFSANLQPACKILMHYAIPDSIHIPPIEGIEISCGVGSVRLKQIKKMYMQIGSSRGVGVSE